MPRPPASVGTAGGDPPASPGHREGIFHRCSTPVQPNRRSNLNRSPGGPQPRCPSPAPLSSGSGCRRAGRSSAGGSRPRLPSAPPAGRQVRSRRRGLSGARPALGSGLFFLLPFGKAMRNPNITINAESALSPSHGHGHTRPHGERGGGIQAPAARQPTAQTSQPGRGHGWRGASRQDRRRGQADAGVPRQRPGWTGRAGRQQQQQPPARARPCPSSCPGCRRVTRSRKGHGCRSGTPAPCPLGAPPRPPGRAPLPWPPPGAGCLSHGSALALPSLTKPRAPGRGFPEPGAALGAAGLGRLPGRSGAEGRSGGKYCPLGPRRGRRPVYSGTSCGKEQRCAALR